MECGRAILELWKIHGLQGRAIPIPSQGRKSACEIPSSPAGEPERTSGKEGPQGSSRQSRGSQPGLKTSAQPWEQLCAELSALGWDLKKIPEPDQLFIWFLPRFCVSHVRKRAGHNKTSCDHPLFCSLEKILLEKKKSANCLVVSSSSLDFIFVSWSPPWIGKGSACHLPDVGIPKAPWERWNIPKWSWAA